jgi:hypothetical protein
VVRMPIVFDFKTRRVGRRERPTDDLAQAMKDALKKRRKVKVVKTVEGVPPQVRQPKT